MTVTITRQGAKRQTEKNLQSSEIKKEKPSKEKEKKKNNDTEGQISTPKISQTDRDKNSNAGNRDTPKGKDKNSDGNNISKQLNLAEEGLIFSVEQNEEMQTSDQETGEFSENSR